MPGTARDEHRRPRERQPREPRLETRRRGDLANEPIGRQRGEDHRQQQHAVEGRHDAEPWNERQREQILERGVVVLRQIDRSGQREDLCRAQRIVPAEGFVLEHPLVPDVHTGITAGIAGKSRAHVKWERPREGDRNEEVESDDGDPGGDASKHGAGGGNLSQVRWVRRVRWVRQVRCELHGCGARVRAQRQRAGSPFGDPARLSLTNARRSVRTATPRLTP